MLRLPMQLQQLRVLIQPHRLQRLQFLQRAMASAEPIVQEVP
jgi:hypothetical protein